MEEYIEELIAQHEDELDFIESFDLHNAVEDCLTSTSNSKLSEELTAEQIKVLIKHRLQ